MSKSNKFITLATDFGLSDGFVGAMKGVIYAINPDATIIDISHEIGPQDVSEAAILLEASYRYFPQGTIHVVVVDPGVGSQRRAIAVETERCYFVAPDNGVLTRALMRENNVKCVELVHSEYFLNEVSNTFHGRDIFAPVASHLSLGIKIGQLGKRIDDLVELPITKPEVRHGEIIGSVIHIDRFGNIITDISIELFRSVVPNKAFTIIIAGVKLNKINMSYAEAPIGHLVALFSSFGRLEIAINQANAAEIMKVQKGDSVQINWRTEPL